jgi:predicted RNA-binding Zn-ribbon protein involved in translation (DUF1610 family)
MDKKQRLTKWTEWEIGAHYCWAKGKTVMGDYVCVEVNEKEGHVRMQPVGSNDKVRTFNWRGRFTRIGVQNCPVCNVTPIPTEHPRKFECPKCHEVWTRKPTRDEMLAVAEIIRKS